MKTHHLKIKAEYFHKVKDGSKNFEVRLNDRDFQTGDELILEVYDTHRKVLTGRILHRKVDYILTDSFQGVAPGYVVMSLSKI